MTFAAVVGSSLRSGYALPARRPDNGILRNQSAGDPLIEGETLSRQSRPPLTHFSYVEPSKLKVGGIDPLGMGALNFDLIASALPGINNVTSRIRVYSFTAWAWWRARECLVAQSANLVAPQELQALVDRWEVLFVWSNMLGGSNGGLPGRLKLGGSLPELGIYNLHGAEWDNLRAARRSGQTALQAPVTYGPSTKKLHWLEPCKSDTFRPSPQVMPAVEEFDARVSALVCGHLLQPGTVSVSVEEVTAMHPAWNADVPGEAERRVFRKLFHDIGLESIDSGDHAKRARTLELIRAALAQSPGPISEPDLRRTLASWRFQDGTEFLAGDELRDRALM